MEKLCELTDVSMFYGQTLALNRVGIHVRRGEIVGLLGANGAGKTTLMELLEGLLLPSSGSVAVLGKPPAQLTPQERGDIGLMFQRYALPGYSQVAEFVDLYASLYPHENGADLIARLGLGQFLKKRIGSLSAGQQQRLAFFCAVYGRQGLLILDEPTSALDVRSRRAMRELLVERCRTHRLGVLLSTHELEDAAALCDRIYILDHGEIKLDATSEQLRQMNRGSLRFEFSAPESVTKTLQAALNGGASVPLSLAQGRWKVECDHDAAAQFLDHLLRAETEHGFVSGVQVSSGKLEDIYLDTISHEH
ncbi:multidrug ABC transporter ATP-binding protein [Duganella rhizosphaerae]|uniref:ABC transporter ATP-binding protein n=1 Tax=Duganella rhizosphaerae TaxID=2885763 RepID=UPI0030E9C1C4